MEPSLCATQNTQNERFIPVWLTRTWKQDRNLFHVILGNKRTADFIWYKYYEYYYALCVQNNMTDPHGKIKNVDCLPLMTYGLKLSLVAWILKFKNFNLSFKEII